MFDFLKITSRWKLFLPALAVYLLGTATLADQDPHPQSVTTSDSRTLYGQVAHSDETILVETPQTKTWLSALIVSATAPAPDWRPAPVYVFDHPELAAPKKGSVGLVFEDFRMEPFDDSGKCRVSLVDEKLGAVTFAGVLTRLTPYTFRLEGLEYELALEFSLASAGPAADKLIDKSTPAGDLTALLKAAVFYRLADKFDTAGQYLAKARQLDGQSPEVADEAARLQIASHEDLLKNIRLLRLSGQDNKALEISSNGATEIDRAVREHNKPLADALQKELDALKADHKLLTDINKQLADAGITGPTISDIDSARRLAAIIKSDPARLSAAKPFIETLSRRWAAPFADMELAPETIKEAVDLADQTARFFLQEKPDGIEKLASAYRFSKLPTPLKLSIFRYAVAYPAPDKPVTWNRVSFTHPASGKKFYYYLRLPPGYDRERPTPTLITLHGQNSRADNTNQFWETLTDRLGMILISPEYIYGRDSGYRFSVEEHQAVIGALNHAAASFYIDVDRVYLHGHSQGAHAAWDIGGSHAGRFAGVVPVAGMNRHASNHINFRDSAVYCIDGELDARAPTVNRKSIQVLGHLKCDATYVECQGRQHEFFTDQFPEAAAWMLAHRRTRLPDDVGLLAFRPDELERRWLAIRETETALPADGLEGKGVTAAAAGAVRGNTFMVQASNARSLVIYLSPEQVDFKKPIQVIMNGKMLFREVVDPDWRNAIEYSFTRRNRQDVYLGKAIVFLK